MRSATKTKRSRLTFSGTLNVRFGKEGHLSRVTGAHARVTSPASLPRPATPRTTSPSRTASVKDVHLGGGIRSRAANTELERASRVGYRWPTSRCRSVRGDDNTQQAAPNGRAAHSANER